MQSLRDLQREFGRLLLEPGGPVAMRAGLRIYAGNVRGNWAKALASAYPIVRKIVGEPFFEGLARAYAREHASVSGDLNEFGVDLPRFLARFPDTQDLPYLPDVARMEWLAHRAHFAADIPRVDAARLAAVCAAECSALPLQCAPASALIASPWPLARIWEVHQDDYRGGASIDFESGPGRFLVFRPRWHVLLESLTAGDYHFLTEAERGAALGEALEGAAAADSGFDAASALARWIGKGAITL
jgi:uncharacterized protein